MSTNQYYRHIYSKFVHGLMLLRNKQVNRHIVVFESDDWGSVRMPSQGSFSRLKEKGIQLALPSSYDSADTLASNDDLELLMEVLASVKDSKGDPAKITLNTCVANPDFDKIKANGYQEYYFEPFTETLKRYPHHDRSFELWKEGMEHKVFRPQFHGREHLNPQKWLRYLQEGNRDTMVAFDEGCYSLAIIQNGRKDTFLEAYGIESGDECDFVRTSIKEGLGLFEQLFGFRSESMIAPCYIWDDYVEEEAATHGVRFIQGGYIQRHSPWQQKTFRRITGHFDGECNQFGQCYTVRNCTFEPIKYSNHPADSCMSEIRKALDSHLPAIVSCHRVNFIGELKPDNRDKNLKEFAQLLEMIIKHYPDVVFMSSDELGKVVMKA